MTTGLGIGGSLIGGVIGSLLWKSPDGRFHPAGWFLSIIGAMILIWLYLNYSASSGRRQRPRHGRAPRRYSSSDCRSRAAATSSGRNRRVSSATGTRDACVLMFIAATTGPLRSRTGTAIERRPSSSSWSTMA